MEKIVNWIAKNKKEFWILVAIILVAAFCRLYKIADYMTFLGDEGRDVIIVRRMFTELHFPLIGPGTSIGSMYLGPLYYYMMAPALLLANFSPIGPAVQIAILGVITVGFVWWIGREWFGKTAGLAAAGLYAISPVVIYYSRSSWNPNIMPFFSLLCIYSIWRVWEKHEFKWLIVLGISFAFVLQSHYLGLLLLPTILIFWYLARPPLRYSLIAILLFALLMSPLVIFDFRHNFVNSHAIYKFFTVRQETVSIRPWNAVPKIPALLNQIDTSLMGGKSTAAGVIVSIVVVIAVIMTKNPLLFSWLLFALIGFGVYKQNIYDHYFGFIFAIPFLAVGAFVSRIIDKGKFWIFIGAGLVIFLTLVNLFQNPLRKEPNRLLGRAEDVADKILAEDGDKPFNLAVLAERNYEDGYQYFLELKGAKVLEIDAQRLDETVAKQLFVVCELPKEKCDPTHSPKAEVANYGWSKIETNWEVDGVIIYKLTHSQ